MTGRDGTRRWFGAVLAAGFDAIVNERANAMRWPRGPRRYDLAIFVELARLRAAALHAATSTASGHETRRGAGRGRQQRVATAAACGSARTPTPPTGCSTWSWARR